MTIRSFLPGVIRRIAFATALVIALSGAEVSAQSSCKFVSVAPKPISGASADDNFGYAGAIDGDYAIVGAPGDIVDANSIGSAYVFKRDTHGTSDLLDDSWIQQAKLDTNLAVKTQKCGRGVAISDTWAAVACLERVAMYQRTGTTWALKTYISNPSRTEGGDFGYSVSLYNTFLAVGAPSDYVQGTKAGVAYVYSFGGTSWTYQQTLQRGSQPRTGDRFGHSVSIYGTTIAVGAPYDDWTGTDSGSVYLFRYLAGAWQEDTQRRARSGAAQSHFGWSVAVNVGGALVVGAPGDDNQMGSIDLLEPTGLGWRGNTLHHSNRVAGDAFGYSVAWRGATVLGGAPKKAFPSSLSGAAYALRELTGQGDWQDTNRLGAGMTSGDEFGTSVALAESFAVVGSPYDDPNGSNSGSVRFYALDDGDQDGIILACDNCLSRPNTTQTDTDTDGVGDACDNCPEKPNAPGKGTCLAGSNAGSACTSNSGCPGSSCSLNQEDTDHDGVGDACDNCRNEANGSGPIGSTCFAGPEAGQECQSDLDCPGSRCPLNQADEDRDGVGDACDNCLVVPNLPQTDTNGDGKGDACEGDYYLGDELDAPLGVTNRGGATVTPPTAAFYHSLEQKWYAIDSGAIIIEWRLNDGTSYHRGYNVQMAANPANLQVASVRWFLDQSTVQQVKIESPYASGLTFRYNSKIRSDRPCGTPSIQRADVHLVEGTNLLKIERCAGDNLPDAAVVLQYDEGPGGRLVGFEVLTLVNGGTPLVQPGEVGRRLTAPAAADDCHPQILVNGVDSHGTKVAWQAEAGSTRATEAIVPTRPETNASNLVVAWHRQSPFGNCWPAAISRHTVVWPTNPQLHVVDPARTTDDPGLVLLPSGDGQIYCKAEVVYQAGFNLSPIAPSAGIIDGVKFTALKPGYSVVRLDIKPDTLGAQCGDDFLFVVVKSLEHTNKDDPTTPAVDDSPVYASTQPVEATIGRQILDGWHDERTPDFPFGYLHAGQPFAPGIYNRRTGGSGQILPVNSSDVHGNLEAWWFAQGGTSCANILASPIALSDGFTRYGEAKEGDVAGTFVRLTSTKRWSYGAIVSKQILPAADGVKVEFKFRIGPHTDGADGFSFALLDPERFNPLECLPIRAGHEDTATCFAEEGPRVGGIVALGFDTFDLDGPNDNHVSLHVHGTRVSQVNLPTSTFNLDGNTWYDAQVELSGDGKITLRAKKASSGIWTVVYDAIATDYRPAKALVGFGARTEETSNQHDVKDIIVTTAFDGTTDECVLNSGCPCGIYWPSKVVQYKAVWPAVDDPSDPNDDPIIIASRQGAGAYPKSAKIYSAGAFKTCVGGTSDGQSCVTESCPSGGQCTTAGDRLKLPGWNPDDEHAILLPSGGVLKAFAARDDNPWQSPPASGHPYVLVEYPEQMCGDGDQECVDEADCGPGEACEPTGLWRMGVHHVVGEDAAHGWNFNYRQFHFEPSEDCGCAAKLEPDAAAECSFQDENCACEFQDPDASCKPSDGTVCDCATDPACVCACVGGASQSRPCKTVDDCDRGYLFCDRGEHAGAACVRHEDCGDLGRCERLATSTGLCKGGASPGRICHHNDECNCSRASGICMGVNQKRCKGGSRAGRPCADRTDCCVSGQTCASSVSCERPACSRDEECTIRKCKDSANAGDICWGDDDCECEAAEGKNVVAGLRLDPLFPVNFAAEACLEPDQHTTIEGDALWRDKNGGIWAVEERGDGFDQASDGQPGGVPIHSPSYGNVRLWENWAADRSCQPWRGYWNGNGGTTPWPIVYQPYWPLVQPACVYPSDPTCARLVRPGEEIDRTGQCGPIEVLHDSVGLRLLDRTLTVKVFLPESILLLKLNDLAKLPPHLFSGEISGGTEWPDRVTYDGLNLRFRGVMSDRDKEFLEKLNPNNSIYVEKIRDLYCLSHQQLDPGLTCRAPNPELDSARKKRVSVAASDVTPGWITLAHQNDENCGALPISLEVWRVECPHDPGRIQVIIPTCAFNEKQVLWHTIDGGGEPEQLVYQWQWSDDYDPYCSADPQHDCARDATWHDYNSASNADGRGLREVVIDGESPAFLLSDSYWRARYRGYVYCSCPSGNCNERGTPWAANLALGGSNLVISDWATPVLAEGWIKRVVRGINPFDQRIKDFHVAETSTVVSMIQQAGMRFEEPVPLNCTPDVLNGLGLIEIYETVLARARGFSIDGGISYDPANLALLLVTSKIAGLYVLLANEAFADAADPTIGLFAGGGFDPGSFEPYTLFCFEDQLPDGINRLILEELALLRGKDSTRAPDLDPDGHRLATVYNRLPWNLTLGAGVIAYANNYQVIDYDEARNRYPQGHGDAWGHYTTALKAYYRLLQHPVFDWVVSTEAVNVGEQPVPVGFQYERKFAQVAAARAKTGAQIVPLVFRQRYAPGVSQSLGFPDPEPKRPWGVFDWARRAGQGAYFDWAVANALLDDVDDDPQHIDSIKKIDRTTVRELPEIAASYEDIQATLNNADAGLNPLGLAHNVMPFGLNPTEIQAGKTHFEQIYEKAVAALQNAVFVFDAANTSTQRLRTLEDNLQKFEDGVKASEFDYTGRLIEIFGTPYREDIGEGKTYSIAECPIGERDIPVCPDLYHFDYMDTESLADYDLGLDPAGRTTLTVTFTDYDIDQTNGKLKEFPRTVKYDVETSGLAGLVKPIGPPPWGSRPAPGEIQFARGEVLTGVLGFLQAVEAFEGRVAEIKEQADLLKSLYDISQQEISIMNTALAEVKTLNTAIEEASRDQVRYRRLATMTTNIANSQSENLPQSLIVGLASGGDVTAPARGAIKTVAAFASGLFNELSDGAGSAALAYGHDVQEKQTQQSIDIQSLRAFPEQQRVYIRSLVQSLPGLRINLFLQRQAVVQAAGRYQASLGKGLRLIEERLSFRKRTGRDITQDRYRDMAFRIFRNDALQKYRAVFDLAARYTLLAARAFDYETNLPPADPDGGEKRTLDIVKERLLGAVTNQAPQDGDGLAGTLYDLQQKWAELEDRFGVDPPTIEERSFSLRWGAYRIAYDLDKDWIWEKKLTDSRVDDLNKYPEYIRNCVEIPPSIPPKANPAIVLEFGTQIEPFRNLFGHLSQNDTTVWDDRYAIKVLSTAVRFDESSYPSELNDQVNVYLVPVGADTMRLWSQGLGALKHWHVLDQWLPLSEEIQPGGDFSGLSWLPTDSLTGRASALFDRRRIAQQAACPPSLCNDVSYELAGRSLWNDSWLLIIPGSSLLGTDPAQGIKGFIEGRNGSGGTRDITLILKIYGYRAQ